MPNRKPHVPSYRLHKQSGQAIVTLTDGMGGRRDVLLGAYDTEASRAEYVRVVAEWSASGKRLQPAACSAATSISINEMLLAFWKHAERHYRHADGTPTDELDNLKYALRPLKELYGPLPAADLSPLKLKAVRQSLIDTGLSRGVVNQRIGIVLRVFRWAVSEELVASPVLHALAAVQGLQRGRTEAHEAAGVKPVAIEIVEATLPLLPTPVAALAQLQLLTGCRPGEIMDIRAIDLNTTGPVWTYTPRQHKNSHRGLDRVIHLGPQAQEIVKPFLTTNVNAFLFPRTRRSYRRAIVRACDKAGVPRWTPLQLRHTAATLLRAKFGLEAAKVILGHTRVETSQIYAERDMGRAAEIMGEIG